MDYPTSLTCETLVVRFEQYLRGSLPRHDALTIAAHLEACALCAQLLALLRGTLRVAPPPAADARTGARRRGLRPRQPPQSRPSP